MSKEKKELVTKEFEESSSFLEEHFYKQEEIDLEIEDADPFYREVKRESSEKKSLHPIKMQFDDYEIKHVQKICPRTGQTIDISYPVATGPVVKFEKDESGSGPRTETLLSNSIVSKSGVKEYKTPFEKRVPSLIIKGIYCIPFIGRLFRVWFDDYKRECLHNDLFRAFGQEPKAINSTGKIFLRTKR